MCNILLCRALWDSRPDFMYFYFHMQAGDGGARENIWLPMWGGGGGFKFHPFIFRKKSTGHAAVASINSSIINS